MAYIGDWTPPLTWGEITVLKLSFADRLNTGDTIISATSSIKVYSGVDINAQALIIGNPTIDSTGTMVSQKIGPNFFAGVTYTLIFKVVTNGGEIFISWGNFAAV